MLKLQKALLYKAPWWICAIKLRTGRHAPFSLIAKGEIMSVYNFRERLLARYTLFVIRQLTLQEA